MDLPFGQPYASDPNTAPTDYTYTGQRWQSDIGLHHYGARWYNSSLGRFISPDTIVPAPGDPQSLNRYSYVNNNPMRYTDPTGHYLFEDDPNVNYIVSPNNNVTGQAVGVVNWNDLVTVPPTTFGEAVATVTAPFWGAGMAMGAMGFGEAAVVPAAQASWTWLLETLGLACADGDCTNETSGIVDFARSQQGSGIYSGVDEFSATVLQEGELVVGGLPGQSHFYTSFESLRRAGSSAETLWKGLQVAEHSEEGYRTVVGVYRVLSNVPAATGQALANIDYGLGGYTQYVIENYQQVLELLYTVTLQ